MLKFDVTSTTDAPFALCFHAEIPVERGVCGIIGPSGCGKTTLLRVLAGLEQRIQGSVSLHQRVLLDSSNGVFVKPEQRRIGYVFQDTRLFPHLSVHGNLEFAVKRAKKPQRSHSIEDVVSWLNIAPLLSTHVNRLSGGEKQRVAIARALLSAPDLLLLDEPFSALDGRSKADVMRHLQQAISSSGISVLLVTHDLVEMRQLTDYLMHMERGKLTAQGDTLSFLSHGQLDIAMRQQVTSTLVCEPGCDFNQLPENLPGKDSGLECYSLEDMVLWGAKPTTMLPVNQAIRCMIHASEVSLSLTPLEQCSIANCLPVVVESIEPLDASQVLISLTLGEQVLLAQISRYSLENLNISVGDSVFALIKAASVRPLC